jgi:hypothetical protein
VVNLDDEVAARLELEGRVEGGRRWPCEGPRGSATHCPARARLRRHITREGATVLAPGSWLPSAGGADGVAVSSVVPGPGDDLRDGPKDEPRLIVLDEVTGLTSDDEAPLGREL